MGLVGAAPPGGLGIGPAACARRTFPLLFLLPFAFSASVFPPRTRRPRFSLRVPLRLSVSPRGACALSSPLSVFLSPPPAGLGSSEPTVVAP